LVAHGIQLVELCVGAAHYHLLARFTPVGSERCPGIQIPGLPEGRELDTFEILTRVARHFLGIAKKDSARALSDAGLVTPGGVWAVRGALKPILDRQHQINVVGYIRDHAVEGAAVWSRIARPPEA
jgi:hypothetical protein